MRIRSGAALTEALFAAVLMSLVTAMGVTLLQTQNRIAHNVSARSERNDASRSVLLIMHAETRALSPASDLRMVARDSLAARVFRGTAIVCAQRGRWSYVRYRGLRLPDPAKDSALQVGVENAVRIADVAADQNACISKPDEEVVGLEIEPRPHLGSMWLVFESGAYHLSANALRYRRGTESRQPITNELFDDRRSAFELLGDSAAHTLRITVTGRSSSVAVRARVHFANAP